MPIRRRRVARRRPIRRRGMRRMRRRVGKTLNAMKDRARVVEVIEYQDFAGNTGAVQQFKLSEFARATAVAQNYRFYRATKIELEFIPFANIFAPGQAFPELYYQQDYTAFIGPQAPTDITMKGRGVIPIKWTKPIKRTYTPAVLRYEQMLVQTWKDAAEYYVNNIQPLTATPVKNKWYMTETAYTPLAFTPNATVETNPLGAAADPTNLVYTGSAFYINTPVAMAGNIGRVFAKVHWEFKQPLVPDKTSPNVDLSGSLVNNVLKVKV